MDKSEVLFVLLPIISNLIGGTAKRPAGEAGASLKEGNQAEGMPEDVHLDINNEEIPF